MEIRRDPITQSWVVVGHRDSPENDSCPFERPAIDKQQTILASPSEGPWQVRVVPHPDPLYRIEGEAGRQPDGMYDRMGPIGAHEVVVETPDHNKRLSQLSDEEWLAINTVLDESTVRHIIPRLKEAGAQGIVEYPLNKIVV